jgi:hypothetical protein
MDFLRKLRVSQTEVRSRNLNGVERMRYRNKHAVGAVLGKQFREIVVN